MGNTGQVWVWTGHRGGWNPGQVKMPHSRIFTCPPAYPQNLFNCQKTPGSLCSLCPSRRWPGHPQSLNMRLAAPHRWSCAGRAGGISGIRVCLARWGPKWRLTKRCLECVMLLFSSGEKWAQRAQQGHPSFWDPSSPWWTRNCAAVQTRQLWELSFLLQKCRKATSSSKGRCRGSEGKVRSAPLSGVPRMVKAWESHVVLRSQSRETLLQGSFMSMALWGTQRVGEENGLGTQLGMAGPCGPSEPDRTRSLSWMEASFWRLVENRRLS